MLFCINTEVIPIFIEHLFSDNKPVKENALNCFLFTHTSCVLSSSYVNTFAISKINKNLPLMMFALK